MILNFIDKDFENKESYICETLREAERVIALVNKISDYKFLKLQTDSFHTEKDIRRWYELRKLEIQNKLYD